MSQVSRPNLRTTQGRKEGREGGREGGRKGGREEGRKGGREEGRQELRERKKRGAHDVGAVFCILNGGGRVLAFGKCVSIV